MAVSVLVFPQRKIDVLKSRLEAQAAACADKCRLLVAAFNARRQSVDDGLLAGLVKAEAGGKALVQFMKNDAQDVKQELEQAVAAVNTKLLAIHREGRIRRFEALKLVPVFSFYSSLLYFADDLLAGSSNAEPISR